MTSSPFVLTGRKLFAIFATGFGIIIAVNMTLAVNAVRTFPGLETRNSYVASQHFNEERAMQRALGWTAQAQLTGEGVVLDLRDATGLPLGDASLSGVLGRATNVSEDIQPDWTFDGTHWRATTALAPGNWDLRLVVTRGEDSFRRRLKLRAAQ